MVIMQYTGNSPSGLRPRAYAFFLKQVRVILLVHNYDKISSLGPRGGVYVVCCF